MINGIFNDYTINVSENQIFSESIIIQSQKNANICRPNFIQLQKNGEMR